MFIENKFKKEKKMISGLIGLYSDVRGLEKYLNSYLLFYFNLVFIFEIQTD